MHVTTVIWQALGQCKVTFGRHKDHLAMTKSSRTIRLPSPMYFCTSSLPDTRMKVQSVWWATARASRVLPVPGGPYSSTPWSHTYTKTQHSSIQSFICFLVEFYHRLSCPSVLPVPGGPCSSTSWRTHTHRLSSHAFTHLFLLLLEFFPNTCLLPWGLAWPRGPNSSKPAEENMNTHTHTHTHTRLTH